MKKKIIGIFMCMLMIAAVVLPVAGTMNKRDADPNRLPYPCSVPNDPDFNKQWYLNNRGQLIWYQIFLFLGKIPIKWPARGLPDADIDAPEAWEITTGSPDVVIAIFDIGVDYTHPDLAANIWNNADEIPNNGIDDDANGYIDDIRGWDFANNDNDPIDVFGHGTLCAGVVGAVGNNGIGIIGIAWNCKIMPVRVIDDQGWCYSSVIAEGIRYATDNGANVISMSFNADDSNNTNIMLDAVNYAYSKGVFLCAAAGNENTSTGGYPAEYDNVTAVGYTNQKDKATSASNYGDWVDIAAPGNLIYTTDTLLDAYDDYLFFGGSSAATPIVAGVAALLLSKDPSLTPDEVKSLLCNNVDPYSGDKYIGTGRVNAYKALAALTELIQ
jgi:subtilisin family serine protease